MSIPPPPSGSSRRRGVAYSTFLLRLVAYMADSLVLGLLWLVVLYLLDVAQDSQHAAAINVIISAVFFIYCHGRWGATPGKMILSLQVVSIDGRPISYLQSLVRYSPYLVAGSLTLFLPGTETAAGSAPPALTVQLRVFLTISLCWYAASVVYMLNRPDRRTLHDLLAYTVVVMRKEDSR